MEQVKMATYTVHKVHVSGEKSFWEKLLFKLGWISKMDRNKAGMRKLKNTHYGMMAASSLASKQGW